MKRARLDCLVIGAGPAGLTAALYLARFGRRFAIVDSGNSRAARIPTTHTLPMFPGGMSGPRLLAMMRKHLLHYRVRVRKAEVIRLARRRHGWIARLRRGKSIAAPRVILCTGAMDVELAVPGVESAVRDGLIRYCPICDGPEAAFERIGVLGFDTHAVREALFIARTYSRRVTLLTLGRRLRLEPSLAAELDRRNVRILGKRISGISFDASRGATVRFARGTSERFDTLYSALGLAVRSDLAARAGAKCTSKGKLRVNDHQETTLSGVYAAGGVVEGLDQLLIAMGHAAIAAVDVHNKTERAVLPARRRTANVMAMRSRAATKSRSARTDFPP